MGLGGVDGEGGVVVARIGRGDRVGGGGPNGPRGQLGGGSRGGRRGGDAGADKYRRGVVVVRLPADLAVGDIGGEHHATARRGLIGIEQAQRPPGRR